MILCVILPTVAKQQGPYELGLGLGLGLRQPLTRVALSGRVGVKVRVTFTVRARVRVSVSIRASVRVPVTVRGRVRVSVKVRVSVGITPSYMILDPLCYLTYCCEAARTI